MTFFSAAEMAGFRALQAAARPDTCAIQSYTAVADGEGGQTDTWATAQTGVPCRVSPTGLTSDERVIAERLGLEQPYLFNLPTTVTISERDRLVWEAQTFEVKGVALRTYEDARLVLTELIA